MAVSQRNFLPFVFIAGGIVLFAFLGFGRSDSSQTKPTDSDVAPVTAGRDEAEVDEVARMVAEESDETEKTDEPESSSTQPEKDPESERLNLSGQAVDDTVRRSSDGKFDISFDNIKFDIPEGEPYSPDMLTDQVRSLDGQEVKLRGYIRPSFKQRDLKNFIFVRDNKECCFGPGAALFDCVVVKLAKDEKTDYTVRPVAVTGKFVLKEYTGPDGNVWAIYRLKNAAVTR